MLLRWFAILALCLAAALASARAQAQELPPAQQKTLDAENELHRAIAEAGSDRAALVRNLEDYLRRFPDAPRKVQVYRALVEASLQLNDSERAVDYIERIIALQPDDSTMLLLAADLLEQAGGEKSLVKAIGYVTRVLDRVEKAPATETPEHLPEEEWNLEQQKLLMSVYLIRGRLEMERRNYAQARADLEASYETIPTPAAAMRLGDLAEVRGDYPQAVRHYTTAFVLPDHYGAGVDRRDARRKLGNVWRRVHGSEAGLGEHLLAAYDLDAGGEGGERQARNAGVRELYSFTLRRPDGTELRLAEMQGQVMVVHFWASWCLPCREIAPVFERMAREFAGRDAAFLAASVDDDEARVAPYVEREKMRATVAFADGLEKFLAVQALPTVIVLDRAGNVFYRNEAFDSATFAADLANALRAALAKQ